LGKQVHILPNLESLITDLQNGDKKAFSVIYKNFSPAIFGIVSKIILDKEVAKDVLQESFVKIWKNAAKYDSSKGTFFTWMLNIARNTAIDNYRKNKKEVSNINLNELSNVSLLDDKISEIKINHIGIREIINTGTKEHKEVIDFLYYKGYTHQELSEELGLPLGTIKSRVRAALSVLRDKFGH